jgi:hypothetical protein
MTETWLLVEEQAIREAAGNPRGRVDLEIPGLREIERIADPKETLGQALLTASEAGGRRRRQLSASLPAAKYRVASLLSDLTVLRRLSAFAAFEEELVNVLSVAGWGRDAAGSNGASGPSTG